MTIASGGQARCVIVSQAGASPAERNAAQELATTLRQVTGASFAVGAAFPVGSNAIIVGPGTMALKRFPEIDLARFHGEELVERSKGRFLLLAGGRPRGTLYAVHRFLEDQVGIHYWAPYTTEMPHLTTLKIPALNIHDAPAFEYRDPYWFSAFNVDWAAHNFDNGERDLGPAQGGKVTYAPDHFVHTFYQLVPPDKYFGIHPEWYSQIAGKRTATNAQLCLTNPALRDFVVDQVRDLLRKYPETDILSVSQNDCQGACECQICKAIDDAEGSHAGTMIDFVNYVADKIAPEFPNVAIDTLAYQFSRKPPKTIRPRPNVIVRLCSIECNFAEPLDGPSNARFGEDMKGWSKLCNRLYVWDYSTDFGHYVQPHPNWFALGDDIRFFQRSHVKGLFSEGAYQSNGSEMSELRSYVLAKLMWNPDVDDNQVINEFLAGYYGKPAAPYIRRYLDLLHGASKGYYLTCGSSPAAPFLSFQTLTVAERLWNQAEKAAASDPERLWRVRQGHLPVRYVWLARWTPLRNDARQSGATWPLAESRKAVAADWLATATGPGPAGWKPMSQISEGGQTPQSFVAAFTKDPAPPGPPPTRRVHPTPPSDISESNSGIDVQDDAATLADEGTWAETRTDISASDGVAVWMPANHHEWAFQVPVSRFPVAARSGRYKVYVSVRISRKSAGATDPGLAFTAGVWDAASGSPRAGLQVAMPQIADDSYHSYLLGAVDLKPEQYIYVAPNPNPALDAVWVDRVFLVPAK